MARSRSPASKARSTSPYDIPAQPGFGRKYVLDFTHLYAPLSKFDTVLLDGNRLFLKYRDALIAITTATALTPAGADELIQPGRQTFWVTEASSTDRESLGAFEQRIRAASIDYDGKALTYSSGAAKVAASFAKGCGDDPFPRLQSPYGTTSQKSSEMSFAFAGHSLKLDFDALRREIN